MKQLEYSDFLNWTVLKVVASFHKPTAFLHRLLLLTNTCEVAEKAGLSGKLGEITAFATAVKCSRKLSAKVLFAVANKSLESLLTRKERHSSFKQTEPLFY